MALGTLCLYPILVLFVRLSTIYGSPTVKVDVYSERYDRTNISEFNLKEGNLLYSKKMLV